VKHVHSVTKKIENQIRVDAILDSRHQQLLYVLKEDPQVQFVISKRSFTECKTNEVTAIVDSYQVGTTFDLECVALFEEATV